MTDDLYYRRLMENPFHILGVSPGHGIGAIRAREAAIQLSHGPALAAWAVEQLLDPRSRLDAELGWVHDVPEDLVGGLLIGIEERSLGEIIEKCGDLGPLDRITIAMDMIAGRRPDIGLAPLPWLVSGWDRLDPGPYMDRINEMRASAGEATLDAAGFSNGLAQLRATQASFIEELMMRGGGTGDKDLNAAAMSFILGESGRLRNVLPPETDAPAGADERPVPQGDPFAADHVPADGDGFGIFEGDPLEDASSDADQIHDPQDGYQDEAVISAIMEQRDDRPDDGETRCGQPMAVPGEHRRSRRLPAVAAFMLLGVAILGSFLFSENENPQDQARGTVQPTLMPWELQATGTDGSGPGVEASQADVVQTAPRTDLALSASLNTDPAPPVVDAASPGVRAEAMSSGSGPPPASAHPEATPLDHLAPAPRIPRRLQLRRPPHGNDDPMSIEEIRYCHAEFMILERLPAFVETEAARRAMLLRALDQVSRCEGGGRSQADIDQVVRELRDYDFTADARRDAVKW
ncbi:hypothetical protein [Paracoccus sp. ME4]|uniref:hypothetical protein n=1 Tax=Paracoccus sp. ME4 TaxID=3138066 RepID=UPI00398A9EFE